MPPSIDALRQRLLNRGTEDTDSLVQRLEKAEMEIGYAEKFDAVIVNDDLPQAIIDTEALINNFINKI